MEAWSELEHRRRLAFPSLPVGSPPPLRRNFLRSAQAIHDSRTWACGIAVGTGHLDVGPTVELLVSELATNAVLHGRGDTFTVEVYPGLLIAVTDAGTDPVPALTRPEDDQEGGRGLAILDALTPRWGVDLVPEGKRVWFQLADPVRPALVQPRE